MTIYNGSIEMGSQLCLVPDVLYHTKQHGSSATVPNYGVNQGVPKIYVQGSEAGTGSPGIGVSFPGPDVPIYNYVGLCQTSQFILAFNGSPFRMGVVQYPSVPFSTLPGWDIECGTFTGGFYARLLIYQLSGTPGFPAVLYTENYGEWPGIPASSSDRNTLLISINPNVHLGGDGPGVGPYAGMYPTTPSSPWPIMLNGKWPSTVGFAPYHGSIAGRGASCGSWISNPAHGFMVYGASFTSSNSMLGFAAFRNQPMMTYEQYLCWHEQHDWSSDPGYV